MNVFKRQSHQCLIVGFVGVALFSGCARRSETLAPTTPSKNAKTTTTTIDAPVFDVPSLLNNDIEKVRGRLGEPDQTPEDRAKDAAADTAMGSIESEENFHTDKADLLVRYRRTDKSVVQFFIVVHGAGATGITDNKDELLQAGNLREGDPRYTVEFVRAEGYPGSYTGVKVIPSQAAGVVPTPTSKYAELRTATVTYSLSGQGTAAKVTYGTSQGRISIKDVALPWTVTTTLTETFKYRLREETDKPIDLSGCVLSADAGNQTITGQILVDNKKVAEHTGTSMELSNLGDFTGGAFGALNSAK